MHYNRDAVKTLANQRASRFRTFQVYPKDLRVRAHARDAVPIRRLSRGRCSCALAAGTHRVAQIHRYRMHRLPTADIAAFLGSLTGKLPQGFVDAPILPASGFDVSQTEAPQH